jgi:elongator complex protein 3
MVSVEAILLDILKQLRQAGSLDDKLLAKIVHLHNKGVGSNKRHFSKKQLLPFYFKVRELEPERWAAWDISPELEAQLLKVLQVKPRRTASGVATITVLTKPWQCQSNCIYCPSDLRMPKSYLSDEPACQRAELNYFDPYLQVASRLKVLTNMGHVTDKIELIVLGGTWSDYPEPYQIWFVAEMFRALNEAGFDTREALDQRLGFYRKLGLSNKKEKLLEFVGEKQQEVDSGVLTYNQAVAELYCGNAAWQSIAALQVAGLDELSRQQQANEQAAHRVVGLVIETRPDTVTAANLGLLRRLGCTKIQMGIQSLNPDILAKNNRNIGLSKIREAFELLRIFGFKIHTHFMLNLYGAGAEADKLDYQRLVTEAAYLPDEVKLYPCVLVAGTKLCAHFASKTWQPYSEEQLLDVLIACTLATPPFVRISRMIRDISAHDIVAGNKKANLRQLVESRIEQSGAAICEMRHREISTDKTDVGFLVMETLGYTTTVSNEYFLQWLTLDNKIAGFLRLSLPNQSYVAAHQFELPVGPGEAMIREVHVYGKVAGVHKTSDGAQHLGLGKKLIKAAGEIAKTNGYNKLNVISSVGTREYYRGLGFADNGLYQQMKGNTQ